MYVPQWKEWTPMTFTNGIYTPSLTDVYKHAFEKNGFMALKRKEQIVLFYNSCDYFYLGW